MTPRQHCLACLQQTPPSVFEAALWVSSEHDAHFARHAVISDMDQLQRQIDAALPVLPAPELAQLLLRQLNALGFQQDDWNPPKPDSALLHKVVQQPAIGAGTDRAGDSTAAGDCAGGRELSRPLSAACARCRSFARPLQRAQALPQRLPRAVDPAIRPDHAIARRTHDTRHTHQHAAAIIA